MGSDELYPGDACLVLHFDNQPVFVARDVEHHPVVATDAGAAVLVFDVLRCLPTCLLRFVMPTLQRAFCIGSTVLTPKLDQ